MVYPRVEVISFGIYIYCVYIYILCVYSVRSTHLLHTDSRVDDPMDSIVREVLSPEYLAISLAMAGDRLGLDE